MAMTILEKIITVKKEEVEILKKAISIEEFRSVPLFGRKCISLKESLAKAGSSGVIAEFKRKSPSKGAINENARVCEVTKGYTKAGAAGLSILTDSRFFGGSTENLLAARKVNPAMPILRKDFMIDPIQVYEAKAFGADVILLIAACLEKSRLSELTGIAGELGLETLVEIHNEDELEKIPPSASLIGVNNRNLKTFRIDIQTSVRLAKLIPENFIKISESGLAEAQTVLLLKEHGFHGFLIGETFMKTGNPAKACKNFISKLTVQ